MKILYKLAEINLMVNLEGNSYLQSFTTVIHIILATPSKMTNNATGIQQLTSVWH